MQTTDVHIWTACPHDVPELQWGRLASLLDFTERAHVAKLKVEDDRRSYVLAHAIRRAALARALDVPPRAIEFSQEPNGRPLLVSRHPSRLFFSHSRSRRAVAFALTRIGPVGIDIEFPGTGATADPDLLAPFIDLRAHRRSDNTAQFYFHWTTLEAFWKAEGTGLSSANPRIRCEKKSNGAFEIVMATGADKRPRAGVFVIDTGTGCAVTLVLHYAGSTARSCSPKLVHCESAAEVMQLFNEKPAQKKLSRD